MTRSDFNKQVLDISMSILNGFNSSSEYDKKYVLPEYDQLQMSHYIGEKFEAAFRGELKARNILCRAGNPKDINEDDIIIPGNRTLDIETKVATRRYTKNGKIAKPHWWTDRNQKSDKLRNFIFIEFEYVNGEFKFHKIYASFQRMSYMDIKTNNITEKFVKKYSDLVYTDE